MKMFEGVALLMAIISCYYMVMGVATTFAKAKIFNIFCCGLMLLASILFVSLTLLDPKWENIGVTIILLLGGSLKVALLRSAAKEGNAH